MNRHPLYWIAILVLYTALAQVVLHTHFFSWWEELVRGLQGR